MSNIDTLFAQADTNNDGTLSEGEFRNLFARNSTFSTSNDFNNVAYETASAVRSGTVTSGGSSSSSFRQSVADLGGDLAANSTQQYQTDAQGFFKDDNPQVIRRPAQEGPVTYTQNIRVRFLQPPPPPEPGPLIIKEVRAAQPPPPPPLRVRQQAPPLPQPPPLVLRERPPPTPPAVAPQTVVRNLPAIPVPPRSLIIERFPPAPPKPRDIIIERWIPYGSAGKRKTIVQRAEAAKEYPKPRNIIIQYETPQVRVIRQFQRLGVTPEDPQAYIQRYGATLFDAQTLVQQARAAGVVEDISPPAATGSSNLSTVSSPVAAMAFDAETSSDGANLSRVSGFYQSMSSSSADAFTAADINRDGVLSPEEFRNAGFQ